MYALFSRIVARFEAEERAERNCKEGKTKGRASPVQAASPRRKRDGVLG